MGLHIVFCSARDANVPLVSRSPDWVGHVVLDPNPDNGVGCLDRGSVCTGSLCPFCADAVDGTELKEAGRLSADQPN